MTAPVIHRDRRCATARPSLFAVDGPRPWAKAETVAWAYCGACAFQAPCEAWALSEGARSLVAGGVYFDDRGRPHRMVPGSTVVTS